MIRAYAVKERGEILVPTVSPTHVAAMVNYIVTYGGAMVYRTATDTQIEDFFQRYKGAVVVEVAIKEIVV